MSGWLQREFKKKEAEARAKEEGASKWAEWLRHKRIYNENISPMTMFEVWGPAPPLESPDGHLFTDEELASSSSEEEEDEGEADDGCEEEFWDSSEDDDNDNDESDLSDEEGHHDKDNDLD